MTLLHGKNYGRPTLDLNFAENKSLIDSVTGRNLITFSRSQSGKEATYVGSDGLIKYAGADEPRFDYDPDTLESLGLLVEESRTNYIKFANFSNWTQTVTAGATTLIPNSTNAPDGTSTASKLVLNNGVTSGYTIGLQSFVVGLPSGAATFSVYAKAAEYDKFCINVQRDNDTRVQFDLTNGTSFNVGGSTESRSIKYVGNGWWRCSVSRTGNNTIIWIQPGPESGTPVVGNGSSGIYIWGPQYESGAFPTSYIPTRGSTVTRNADNASITGTNFSGFYNQSEGTIFAGVSSFSYNNSATLPTFAHFTDGSLNNYIRLNSGPAYLVRNFTNTGGFNQTQSGVSITTPTNNSPYSISLGIATNNSRIYADGNPAALINQYSPPVVNKVEIGNWIAQNNTWLNGHISRLTYWPKRLPDLELQQLTK